MVPDQTDSVNTLGQTRGPLPVVAEILGHRSSAFTVSRYGHVVGGQYREVADVMGDVLGEPSEEHSGSKTG